MPDGTVEDYKIALDAHADPVVDADGDTLPGMQPLETVKEWVLGPSPSACALASQDQPRGLLTMTFRHFYELYVLTCTGPMCEINFNKSLNLLLDGSDVFLGFLGV